MVSREGPDGVGPSRRAWGVASSGPWPFMSEALFSPSHGPDACLIALRGEGLQGAGQEPTGRDPRGE